MIKEKDKQQVRTYTSEGEEVVPADYTKTERNTICVGFKLLIAQRRAAIRVTEAVVENPKYTKYRKPLFAYQGKLKDSISKDCLHLTDIIKDYIIDRNGNSRETEAFFCKLLGDHIRYMCEVNTQPGPQLNKLKKEALMYYERAERKCE